LKIILDFDIVDFSMHLSLVENMPPPLPLPFPKGDTKKKVENM